MTNIDNIFYAVQLHEINGSVIIMDPFNGNIVSMVGGVNYDISNFNRVLRHIDNQDHQLNHLYMLML